MMDLFNKKKIRKLEEEIEYLKNEIKCFNTLSISRYEENRKNIEQIKNYLTSNGRKRTVDGKQVSDFVLFCEHKLEPKKTEEKDSTKHTEKRRKTNSKTTKITKEAK